MNVTKIFSMMTKPPTTTRLRLESAGTARRYSSSRVADTSRITCLRVESDCIWNAGDARRSRILAVAVPWSLVSLDMFLQLLLFVTKLYNPNVYFTSMYRIPKILLHRIGAHYLTRFFFIHFFQQTSWRSRKITRAPSVMKSSRSSRPRISWKRPRTWRPKLSRTSTLTFSRTSLMKLAHRSATSLLSALWKTPDSGVTNVVTALQRISVRIWTPKIAWRKSKPCAEEQSDIQRITETEPNILQSSSVVRTFWRLSGLTTRTSFATLLSKQRPDHLPSSSIWWSPTAELPYPFFTWPCLQSTTAFTRASCWRFDPFALIWSLVSSNPIMSLPSWSQSRPFTQTQPCRVATSTTVKPSSEPLCGLVSLKYYFA